ncbi:reverse transcriptase domain, reverse transcriptase zinc-binding domain protein [Tanacetum coccineum]
MHPFVKLIFGDGKKFSIWYDKWEEHGPNSKFISDREIYNARFNKGACIVDMIQDGKWIWPNGWWSKFPILKQIKVPALNNENDFVRWLNKEGVSIPFSIRGVWINMRYDYPKVDWYKVVWFSQCTPRHAVIMWLAIQNRLQTQDRMAKWCGMSIKGVMGRIGVAASVYHFGEKEIEDCFRIVKAMWMQLFKELKRKLNGSLWGF